MNYEQYVVFEHEATTNILLALAAVLLIMVLLTANTTVSLLILLCVGLVDLYLLGLLSILGVAFNSISNLNVVIAIGLAVDYSAHIGHSYLTIDIPDNDPQTGEVMTNF